jgi:hypothetical protein
MDNYSVPSDVQARPVKVRPSSAKGGGDIDVGEILRQLQSVRGDGEPLRINTHLDLDRLALVFSDSGPGVGDAPLMEVLVTDVQWLSEGMLGSKADSIGSTIRGTLCAEAYNVEKKVDCRGICAWDGPRAPWLHRP